MLALERIVDLREETADNERSDIGSTRRVAGIVDHIMRSPRIWSHPISFVISQTADTRDGLYRPCKAGGGHPFCARLWRQAVHIQWPIAGASLLRVIDRSKPARCERRSS